MNPDQPGPHGALSVRVRAERLAATLAEAAEAGLKWVEMSMGPLDLLFDGRLHLARAKAVVRDVEQSGLAVTVHQPSVLDLRTTDDVEVMRRTLHSTVELCELVEAPILVVHFEAPGPWPELERQFEELLLEAAEAAETVTLAVENIEIAPSRHVVDLVSRLDHPRIGMTWDIGHDVVAADGFGYDPEESARVCAPYVVHVHAQDNFGRFERLRVHDRAAYSRAGELHWSALGRGDLHLPIGWGIIPFERLLEPLRERGYQGVVVSEVRERFLEWHRQEAIDGLRGLLAHLGEGR